MSLLAEGSLIPPVGSLNKPNQIKVTKQKVSYALTSPFLPLFYSHLLPNCSRQLTQIMQDVQWLQTQYLTSSGENLGFSFYPTGKKKRKKKRNNQKDQFAVLKFHCARVYSPQCCQACEAAQSRTDLMLLCFCICVCVCVFPHLPSPSPQLYEGQIRGRQGWGQTQSLIIRLLP